MKKKKSQACVFSLVQKLSKFCCVHARNQKPIFLTQSGKEAYFVTVNILNRLGSCGYLLLGDITVGILKEGMDLVKTT